MGKTQRHVKNLLLAFSLLALTAVSRAQDPAALALPASSAKSPTAPLPIGTVAPDFTAMDASGKDVKLSDFNGKVVVLDFWATWCGPCLASFPHTQEVAAKYKDLGVVVLASGTSDTNARFKDWISKNQSKYPDMRFVFDSHHENGSAAYGDRVSSHVYGVRGIPTRFVIGKDGIVQAVIVGYEPGDLRLEACLARVGVPVDAVTLASANQFEKEAAEKEAKALEEFAKSAPERAKAAEEAKKPMHTEFGSLKAGDAMPQFTVTGADGKALSLSDCAGKTVILSFSFIPTEARMKAAVATMARLSAIAARYKNQGVLVLNIFTQTPRDDFDHWVAGHKGQFAFVDAHDPVGRPAAGSGVKSLIILLSGVKMVRLPAALVVNAQGKFVGYAYGDNATGDGLAMLLQRSGVKLAPDDLPKTEAAN